ncbi:MAG: fibronectin type III domain-containing protein [Elusimicrobiota bacterium]
MKKHLIFLSFLILAPVYSFAQPEGISNLTALSTDTEGQILLEWTVPDTGIELSTPTAYLVKYATSQINNSDFYASWTSTYIQSWANLVSSGSAESRALTGLTPGATLYFAMVAVDSDTVYGIWYSSAEVAEVNNANFAAVLDTSPAQVMNLAAVCGDLLVNLSWYANAEIDLKQYRIERSSWSSTDGFLLLTNILAPETTHYDILNLVNGNTYYYKVRAEDYTGNAGAYSEAVSTVPTVDVSAPSFSAYCAAYSTTSINWAWDPASGAAGYRVILTSSGDTVDDDLLASDTYWIQTGLTPDTSSSVIIQAFNGFINSDSSPGGVLYSLANPPYDIFSPLQPGTTSINLQWTANGNQGYTRYSIERSTYNGNFAQIVALLANTTHQDTGLKEKTTYYYRLWAANSSAAPAATEKITISTMTASANPQAPTFSAARSDLVTNDGEARLQWLAPYDDDTSELVASYIVKKATFSFTDGEFGMTVVSTITQSISPTTPGDPEELIVTGLYPGATYYFGIKALDEAGNYSPLSVIRSTVARDNIPSAPALVSAYAVTETTVSIQWSHTSIPGYDDKKGYVIYRATFNFTLTGNATFSVEVSTYNPGTSYNDSTGGGTNQLRKETTYYYMLATRDLGDGPAGSGLTSAILESLPTAVTSVYMPDLRGPYNITNISAATGAAEGKINLIWSTPPEDYDTQTGNITGGKFRLDWTTNDLKEFTTDSFQLDITTTAAAGTSNYLMLNGLGEGVTYYFRIWSADESGNWSAVSIGATAWSQIDVTAPSPVTSFTASPFWRGAVLAWTVPGDNGYSDDISGGSFEIKYSTSQDDLYPATVIAISTSAVQGTTVYYTITGLENSVTYYFNVKTSDERDNWSGVSVDTPSAGPVNAAPGAFDLNLPENNYISQITMPVLQWLGSVDSNAVYGDTVSYTVYYSTDQNFELNVTTAVSAGTALSYGVPDDLMEDKSVYWKVLANDEDNALIWSASIYTIRINAVNSAPESFTLVEPNAVSTNTATPRLSWTASSDIDPGDLISYKVDYSLYENFSSYVSSAGISGLNYTTPALTDNVTYYWRVWVFDGLIYTMSDTTYYVVINAVPEAPLAFNLISPADNTRELSLKVTFYWEMTSDPDPFNSVSYNLSYSNILNFASSTTVTGLSSSWTIVNLPVDNMKYYWRVDAIGSDGRIRQSNQTRMAYTDIEKELPQAFAIQEPFGVTISTTLKPWFFWDAAIDIDPADIVRYYIDISIDQNFTGSQAIPTGTDNFYQPLSNLLDQSTYYWRVRASGYQYQGSYFIHVDSDIEQGYVFSTTGTFAISMTNNPPLAFNLISPADGAVVSTKKPIFTWSKSVDNDLNDDVTYTLVISTIVSDFSSIYLQASNLSDIQYAVTSLLSENKTYYWKVISRDIKALETTCSKVFSFTVPVINRPASPAGLRGTISQDEQSITLYWSAVTRNNDGNVLDDLAGYNIYRSLSIQSMWSGNVYAFVPAGTKSYTDTAVQGGQFYYMVKAVDSSGIEGGNSLIIESLNPEKMNLVSSDQQVTAELPSDVSKSLLAENNKWNDDLAVEFNRDTGKEAGKTLRVYDLRIRDSNFTEITDYKFSTPVTLQFSYSSLSAAPGISFAQGFSPGELSVYWHNGVEFIRIGGYMDEIKKRVAIRVTKPGQYQLRQVVRASSFGLASLDPAKVFTPGTAPYEKMTFYVDNPTGDKVTGKVFDMRGEFVADLKAVGDMTATTVTLEWDGNGARKGVYIYQIEGDGTAVNGTIILAR